jgi:hypothetical protein
VVVWIFASLVADLPSIDSRAVVIANYFDDEHVSVVTSVYFQGLALVCFFFFLGGLAVGLERAGERWRAATQLSAAGLPLENGASRTRTGDLLGAIQALSQLSYSPARRTV